MTKLLTSIRECLQEKSNIKISNIFDTNQTSVLLAIEKSDTISIIKPRQSGITSAALYYVAKTMKFSYDRKNIAFFGHNHYVSEDFIKKLGFLLRGYRENNLRTNRKDLYLEGSCFRVFEDYYKLRGQKYDIIIVDEASHHNNFKEIITYAKMSLSKNGKLICFSTPGGPSDYHFTSFHFKLNDYLEISKTSLIVEKNNQYKKNKKLDIKCHKNRSTELKKEKLNIY